MQERERLDVIKAAVNMDTVSCKVCNGALKFIDKMLYFLLLRGSVAYFTGEFSAPCPIAILDQSTYGIVGPR
jgi:hypothetical protein